MRNAIFDALFARMARDPRVFFLTADVGLGLVERFRDAYPDRFLNVGVCEVNLIGVAAGLCNAGYHPVCYTISNFITERCFEQLRDDVALHDYPVVLLGLGGGFDNCQLGPTHHMVSDWGVLRNLPGVEVHCPSSIPYAGKVLDYVLDRKVPAYLRIPKGGGSFSTLAESDHAWFYHSGRGHSGRGYSDTLLVSYGSQAESCREACLRQPAFGLLVLNQLRPLPAGVLLALTTHRNVVVVEDHFAETGLYASVCQFLMEHVPNRVWVHSRAPRGYYREAGDTPVHFWKKYGGDAESLVKDFS